MEKIVTAAQMRHAEELTEKAGTSTAQLMQNAGAAAARVIAEALARGGPEARDLPSGVDADTGLADPHTVPATITITMGFLKRGLLLGRGAELAGHVVTADIGMAPDAAMDVPLWRVAEEDVRARIPARPRDVNKYSAGAVLVVAGSRRFTGAPQLAALGAARAGAGLVTLATGASTHPILAAHLLEPTFLVLADDAHGVLDPAPAGEGIPQATPRYRALLRGPGLAQAENT